MDKVKAKNLKGRNVRKYKMKTKKAAQKRFMVVGGLRHRAFAYHPVGHRHLNRNKSTRNIQRAKKSCRLTHIGDVNRMKKLLPYFKKKKALGR